MTAEVIRFPGRGFYTVRRLDDDVARDLFGSELVEPKCRLGAWHWLHDNAAWKATDRQIGRRRIPIERGELCHSYRFLAKKWRWSHGRVQRWLQLLEQRGVIAIRKAADMIVITLHSYGSGSETAASERVTSSKAEAREIRDRGQEPSQRRIHEKDSVLKQKGEHGRCAPSADPAPTEEDKAYVAALVERTRDALQGKKATRVYDPAAYQGGIESRKWRLWLAGAHCDGGLYKFACDTIPVGPALFAVQAAISTAIDAGSREALQVTDPDALAAIDRLDRVYRKKRQWNAEAAKAEAPRREKLRKRSKDYSDRMDDVYAPAAA